MINNIFEITTVLFECLLVHIFFNGCFGIRAQSSKTKVLLAMLAYFILQGILSLFAFHPVSRVIASYFLVFGVAAFLYETSKAAAFFSSLIYIALAVVSEYLCLVFLGALNFDIDTLLTISDARLVFLALAKTVQLIAVLAAATALRKNRVALSLKQVLPLLPCVLVCIYLCVLFFSIFPEHEEHEDQLSLRFSIAVVGFLYVNGIIILHTQHIKTAVVEAEEQKLAMQHYEMQEQYYQSVLKNRDETRALWHDLGKHITAIDALVKSGNNNDAISEYEQMRQTYKDLGDTVDVGNSTLDTILHHNITRAKSHNITVRLDAYVPPELPVSAVDLSVIIGNTFDNAIEECMALPIDNPVVDVSIAQKNNMLFYDISNPCGQTPHKKIGNIHGYGLRNVARCVGKYSGSLRYGKNGEQFCVSARLNCAVKGKKSKQSRKPTTSASF